MYLSFVSSQMLRCNTFSKRMRYKVCQAAWVFLGEQSRNNIIVVDVLGVISTGGAGESLPSDGNNLTVKSYKYRQCCKQK